MIRLTRCTQASKAGTYFRLHLQTGDSDEGPIKPGVSLRPRWFGGGSTEVGLGDTNPPSAQHLTRLGRGLHPTQKVRLAPSVNRKRAYYDLTIAAPKTVSIAALLRPDHPTARAVLNAHVAAIEKVAGEVTTIIHPTRAGHPKIQKWIGVSFHHTHTRENDPHLHTHLVIPNVGKNDSGDWRAIQIKIGGHYRQKLELRYGHELARQLRLIGLGPEIIMRPNGLPELRSLLPLRKVFSKATVAVQKAGEDAGAQILPIPNAPASGLMSQTGRSGLPIHPQRSAIRFRRLLADDLRKPKTKASDDPALLRDEAVRWTGQLGNIEMRTYLEVMDKSDPAIQQRRPGSRLGSNNPTVVVAAPLPALRDFILYARRKHLDYLGKNTPTVIFRAVMTEAAGRYDWREIRRAMVIHLKDYRERMAKVRQQINEDSIRIEADRINRANLAARGIIIVPLPPSKELLMSAARNRPVAISGAEKFAPVAVQTNPGTSQAPAGKADEAANETGEGTAVKAVQPTRGGLRR